MRSIRVWNDGSITSVEAEIRRLLREPIMAGEPSFWDSQTLKDLWNSSRGLLEMDLSEKYEGYNLVIETTDIVAGQVQYQIPTYANRLHRVLLADANGNTQPLDRDERYQSATSSQSSGFLNYQNRKSYRLVGGAIYLNQVPAENITDGLVLELEEAKDRVVNDSDLVMPNEWPVATEDLLIIATALAAFDIENAMAPPSEGYISSLASRLSSYYVIWSNYVENKSRGLITREPWFSYE